MIWVLVLTLPSTGNTQASHPPETAPIQFGATHSIAHGSHRTSGPALALSEQGVVHVVWSEQVGTAAKAITYRWDPAAPRTSTPSPGIQVNPMSTPVASTHEPPALALGPDNEVYVAWTSPHPLGHNQPFASILLLSRSLDGGQSFLEPVQVNDDQAVTGHSFDSLAVSSRGLIHLAWLDAREGTTAPAVYTARSLDGGRTILPNKKIDDHACVCCRTATATADDGTVYVAWRKVLAGNVREVVVARSDDHGTTFSTPVIVGHDHWVFAGCPHRPASLDTDSDGRVYIVWYTEGPDDTPGVYIAVSDDRGQTFTPRTRLNSATGTFPDHPQMAVDARGQVIVVWEEQSPVRREVVMSYSSDRGEHFSAPLRLNTRKAKRPAIAMNTRGEAVLAWLEQKSFPHWSTVLQHVSVSPPSPAHVPMR